ncbi:hypothetical protein BD779DRAFT_1611372 [Infundibulicybe gibba]|nr:hypothetical protein BD779DRAFT_1611372 [Infundibulicybe gibba]
MARGQSHKFQLYHRPTNPRMGGTTRTGEIQTYYVFLVRRWSSQGIASYIQVKPKKAAPEAPVFEEPHVQWREEPALANEADPRLFDPAYVEHLAEMLLEPTKRTRMNADEPLAMWMLESEVFLEEMITLEGCGWDPPECCCDCLSRPADHECLDCLGRHLRCAEEPLHRIKYWNGSYFEDRTLKTLGLRIQLGHRPGVLCMNPETSFNSDFTILDNWGIFSNPRTAATFRVLETLEMLSYTSKVSVFEFYQALNRLTDNTKMNPPQCDRYPQLLRMIREWRYLKLLKHAGCGHNPKGISAAQPGECAVLCPACPQPGKNMPQGWKRAPQGEAYLHSRFLAIDANFRLRRKDVSSDAADPSLSKGLSYFVEELEYKKYLTSSSTAPEPKSTCSRHDAVNLASSKRNGGVAATGVGAVVCARHDFRLPNSVGDLQFGERYSNMDYLFYKSVQGTEVMQLFVSYDIAYHTFDILDGHVNIKFLVPKFHLPAHVAACRTRYSFNFTKGVGRTDGEAPERGWSEVDPLAPSTKEMGPGSRRDTLDFHFGDSNWRKMTSLGLTLMRKLKIAASEMVDYVVAHRELEASLPGASIATWRGQIEAWEEGRTLNNPFEVTTETPTQAAARRELSEAEARDLEAGKDISLDENVSPSVLISVGMDLETEHKLWDHSKDRQRTRLQLRTNALKRKIDGWFKILQLYIPPVALLCQKSQEFESARNELPPHKIQLWLPSAIGKKATFSKHLAEIEWKLRIGQAYESLDALRNNLRIRSHLFKFKDRFIRGQAANTRARNSIDLIQARVDASGEEYRAARSALVSLGGLLGKVGWQEKLPILADSDKHEISEGEFGISDGKQKLSWIWKSLEVAEGKDDSLRDALRIEWCKSRARAARFTEEVELLMEEMRRVQRFLVWQEEFWITKGSVEGWGEMSTMRTEGLVAYANRQAALRCALNAHFSNIWASSSTYVSMMKSAAEAGTISTDAAM